jgi:hypothetical protein
MTATRTVPLEASLLIIRKTRRLPTPSTLPLNRPVLLNMWWVLFLLFYHFLFIL